MATLTIFPHLNPRVIEVDAPTTNISVQELVDLIRAWEDMTVGLDYPYLIDAAGKEDLGGGTSVGITATLRNAVVAFALQGGVDSSGTVTTADATGNVLTDSSGTFISDGILAGDTVLNVTDQSITSVQSVDSETQLTTFGLESGVDNQFDISDSYKIWNKVPCEISGGNLVAVDENGATMSAFLPTAQTHVVRTSSSSATLQSQTALEFSVFNGQVQYDPANITGLAISGTTYPAGTALAPSNNITDALSIATTIGTKTLRLLGNPTFDNTISLDGYRLIGTNRAQTIVTFSSADTGDISIENCRFSGSMNGSLYAKDCMVGSVTGVGCTTNPTVFENCHLQGNIQVRADNNKHWHLVDCSTTTDALIELDVNSSPGHLAILGHQCRMRLKGVTEGNDIHCSGKGMELRLDPTCTSGTIEVHGDVNVIDEGSALTFDNDTTTALVWNELVANHLTAGTTGKALSDAGGAGNPWSTPVSGNTDSGTFGELVGKKLLTIGKFLGLK